MRNLHAVLAGGVLCAGACIALGLGIPGARAQEDRSAETAARRGIIERAGELLNSRSRDALTPFQTIIRSDVDLHLGRVTLFLGGFHTAEEGTIWVRAYVATEQDVMDLRTLTHSARLADGSAVLMHDFDPAGNVPYSRAKAFFNLEDSPASHTIHFDPPVRVRAGDLILMEMVELGAGDGSGLIALYGTVPAEASGDSMRIE